MHESTYYIYHISRQLSSPFLQKKTTLILKPLSDGWENMGAGPCM